jgi:hypothetical protein
MDEYEEADFWTLLEFRASWALGRSKRLDQRFLALDGIIPAPADEQPLAGAIIGKAWVVGGPNGLWDLKITLTPAHAGAFHDRRMLSILPAPDAVGWVSIDRDRKEVLVRLG